MHLRYIRYFLTVAEYQSFTKAAEALHISQPALSQQIKLLEENLNTQLFDRSGRAIRLTDAGKIYLEYTQRAFLTLHEGKQAIHDMSNLSRGSIRIAVTPTFITYFIGLAAAQLNEQYPNITLHIYEASQSKIEQRLLKNEIDLGIAFDESYSSQVAYTPLLVERLAFVVSTQHPLAMTKEMSLKQLRKQQLVLLNQGFATRRQIDQHFRKIGLYLEAHMEVESIGAILEIIKQSKLATIIPEIIPLHQSNLIAIPLKELALERTAILMHRKGAWQSSAVKAFIDIALQIGQDMMAPIKTIY
ncbi:transcriptional regulator CynR [Ignatzschineria larvae]|nr:transcriptional regulator CynR [Ignatzschineria larvae]